MKVPEIDLEDLPVGHRTEAVLRANIAYEEYGGLATRHACACGGGCRSTQCAACWRAVLARLLRERGTPPPPAAAVSATLTLFDDAAVREKLKVMTRWEAMTDDARNPADLADRVEALLAPGRTYRVTIEEVPGDG